MWSVDPRDLGAQLFSPLPKALRSHALQIECVIGGLKPGCLIPLYVEWLEESVGYLRGRGLAVAIDQRSIGPSSYAQTSPAIRKEIISKPRVRLYTAKTASDARTLARLETQLGDYYKLGIALGYPVCCVEAAVEKDQTFFDERYGEWKQTNLNAVAAQRSTSLDYLCNFLLWESELSDIAPSTAIAHSPCHFACRESSILGSLTLECCASVWPLWAEVLKKALMAPTIYWLDVSWPAEFWDEFCGIALVSGHEELRSFWRCRFPAISLGRGRTPAGDLPEKISAVQLIAGGMILHDETGDAVFLSYSQSGNPLFMNWGDGTLQTLS